MARVGLSSDLSHPTPCSWLILAVSGHFPRIEVVGSTDAYKDDYNWDGMMRTAALLLPSQPDVTRAAASASMLTSHFGGSTRACFQSRKCELQAASGSSRLG
jgi:hypothetical protein